MTTATAHHALTDLAADAAGFGRVLAALSSLPDEAHASLPEAWRNLSASLVTLIADDKMPAHDVADASGLPLATVRSFTVALELV